MVTSITDEMRREAYTAVLDELGVEAKGDDTPIPDPVVDAAARYILGLPSSPQTPHWRIIAALAYTRFAQDTQEQLWTVVQVLMTATADWDDFDKNGQSLSKSRIEEIAGCVDEENAE